MNDVIYLTEDFLPVEADDPRMVMVKVRQPDGKIVFGFPAGKVEQNKLFHSGGQGSGDFGHSGRPGKVGGSSNSKLQKPNESQISSALNMGLAQWIPGVYVDPEKVNYSVKLVPVGQITATENKKPSEELIEMYRSGKQIQPISVSGSEGRYTILDGNHRIRAARKAGLSEVWVLAIEGMKK
jgi:hypothetical protein